MKTLRSALLMALMLLMVLAVPAGAATGKPNAPGKGNPYPPGQTGKCSTSAEHGGCPPGSKGKSEVWAFSGTVRAGEGYEAEGRGFDPASQVEAYVDGVRVDSITADDRGAFKAVIPISPDVEAGAHTVRFKGTGSDGQVIDSALPLVVTGPDLVNAASPSTTLTLGAALVVLVALAAGAAFLVRGRRVAAEGF